MHTERQATIISLEMREANEMREELRQERAAAAAADRRAESAEARASKAAAALDLVQQELVNVRRELAEAQLWAAAATEQSHLVERQAAAACAWCGGPRATACARRTPGPTATRAASAPQPRVGLPVARGTRACALSARAAPARLGPACIQGMCCPSPPA